LYEISRTAEALAKDLPDVQKALLTTWLVDQRRSGIICPFVGSDQINAVKGRRRISFSEKKARFFLMLSHRNWNFTDQLFLGNGPTDEYFRDRSSVQAWCELTNEGEAEALARTLVEDGSLTTSASGRYRLAPKGFVHLEEAQRGLKPSAQGFVAMWFDPDMSAIYDRAIEPAIRRAGYEAMRIDKKNHNNKIDDEIIAEIKRSQFIVADFSCSRIADESGKAHWISRGGVYFEAGFAYGLNIPVIWTCRESDIEGVHFDTRQFSHILWSDPAVFEKDLNDRIRHIVGEGPKIPVGPVL
jgi:hypothetical protein